LEEFFSHENQAYPHALSQFGKLRPSNKSLLLNCLEDLAMPGDAAPEVDAVMLDGPAVVHFLTPQNCRTFAEYASKIFLPFIERTLTACNRLDLICDSIIRTVLNLMPGTSEELVQDDEWYQTTQFQESGVNS